MAGAGVGAVMTRRLHVLQWLALATLGLIPILAMLSLLAVVRRGPPPEGAAWGLLIMVTILGGAAAAFWYLDAALQRRQARTPIPRASQAAGRPRIGPLHGLQVTAIAVACLGLVFAPLVVIAEKVHPDPNPMGALLGTLFGFGLAVIMLWWLGDRARRRRPADWPVPQVPAPVAGWVATLAAAALAIVVATGLAIAAITSPPTWVFAPFAVAWLLVPYAAGWAGASAALRVHRGSRHQRDWVAFVCGGLAILLWFGTFLANFPAGSAAQAATP